MPLLDLPEEILRIIIEQIRNEAFSDTRSIHRLPRLDTLCALALTSWRFTNFSSEAIHREVRLVGGRYTKGEHDDPRKARWRRWIQACNKYPQLLERVRILRVMWFASFDSDLVNNMYSCLERARHLEQLTLTVWTGLQQHSALARIGIEPLLLLNVKILELSFHSRRLITPQELDQICRLPSLNILTLQSQKFVFDNDQIEANLDEANAPEKAGRVSKLETLVLDCKHLDHRVLDFLIKKAPRLKKLTIPDKIGIRSDENETLYSKPIPLRPTMMDLMLQPLTDSLEQLTITTPRDYTPRYFGRMDCERPVGFSNFSVLKSLDVPSHFLFDLSGDGDTYLRTSYDLFPKSLKSLRLRFEYFFTIHELEEEWGMTPKDWHNAYLRYVSYVTTGCVVGTQQCRWIALLLDQDKAALRTLRQVYARDQTFDISHSHIVAIDRKISGALDGVDVSVRVRTTERLLEEQMLKHETEER